jgi:hypothetical protein
MTEADAIPMYDAAGRPRFYADPGVDRFAAVLMRLASELWVARERIDTLERVAAAKGVLLPDEIDAYAPDADAAARREADRAAFIATVFAPLRERGEAGANPVP